MSATAPAESNHASANTEPSPHSRRRPLALSIVALVVLGALFPAALRVRKNSQRLVCASNLKGIAALCKSYRNDRAGPSPPTIAWLLDQGLVTQDQTVCPSATLDRSNYVIAPLPQGGAVSNTTPVVYEPKSNHGGEGGNVVYADGHARFVRVPEYDKLIAASLSGRVPHPFPQKRLEGAPDAR